MLRLVIAFLPWIIFAVLANRYFSLALILALAAPTVITVRQIFSRSVKILDSGLIGFRWMILATHMTLLVNLTLMAVAWGSLLVGTPFTIEYAREQVAPEFWHTPLFMRIDWYITAVWGLDFFLCALVSLYRHATGEAGPASQYASFSSRQQLSSSLSIFRRGTAPGHSARRIASVVRPHEGRDGASRARR